MARKIRKTRKPSRKSARKPGKRMKTQSMKMKTKPRRKRRFTKATQVTGSEIDETFEDLTDKTVLERKVDQTMTSHEDAYPNILLTVNYEEGSPFDPDEDVDDEPENRKKMYEVPPKARTPEEGSTN